MPRKRLAHGDLEIGLLYDYAPGPLLRSGEAACTCCRQAPCVSIHAGTTPLRATRHCANHAAVGSALGHDLCARASCTHVYHAPMCTSAATADGIKHDNKAIRPGVHTSKPTAAGTPLRPRLRLRLRGRRTCHMHDSGWEQA